jgi:hypothetical protein
MAKRGMTIPCKSVLRLETRSPGNRATPAPALFQLLTDSALSRAALGACGFAIGLLDARRPGMPLTFANSALEELAGVRADQLLGRPAGSTLFAPDAAEVLDALALDVQTRGVPAHARVRLRDERMHGPDTAGEAEVALNAVRDVRGAISCWVLSLHPARPARMQAAPRDPAYRP